ncbi:hypothetical protein [Actinocorallia populi]|uniref:hypothetical protein n=1 Tax=Actinocorallia populi TaxID=2079200 RepID=UPI001E326777|nr:hypothetical protein [Actinocorallia populi]
MISKVAGALRALRRTAGRSALPRTVPGHLRGWAAAALLAVIALVAAVSTGLEDARQGLRLVGEDAGPQVVHTGHLYFALSDMDAQLAGLLLIGAEHDLGAGRDRAQERYRARRGEAHRALLQAYEIAGTDRASRRTVRDVLNGLGRYEQLASRALLLNDQSGHPAGPPPQNVLGVYRRATDLMRQDILPKAYNLTLENASVVRRAYVDERSHVLRSRVAVGVTALVLLAVLAGLQVYLAYRFRRLLSPALAAATALTLVLGGWALLVLGSTSSHLRMAKEEGFDPTLAFTRARAISNTAAADQTRFLLDPRRADTYAQVYFDTSQAIAYRESGNLADYYRRLAEAPPELGFLGGVPQGSEVLIRYRAFQEQDERMRGLVRRGDEREAIALRTGLMTETFTAYDQELSRLVAHRNADFEREVAAGAAALDGWNRGLPAAGIVLAALIVLGVWPRLAEYR